MVVKPVHPDALARLYEAAAVVMGELSAVAQRGDAPPADLIGALHRARDVAQQVNHASHRFWEAVGEQVAALERAAPPAADFDDGPRPSPNPGEC